jgi:hypothetical protein
MSIERIARRRFLLGAGGLALALPLLPSVAGTSRAGPVSSPKRFIFLFTSNGQLPENWYPSAPQSWNVLSQSQYVREAPLSGTGGISKVMGPAFDALKPKLVLFRGLDIIEGCFGGSHNPMTPLNGWRIAPAVTIDQILAGSSKVYPAPPPLRSLHMCVTGPQSETTVSMSGEGGLLQPVSSERSVKASYARVFGTFVDDQDPLATKRAALKASLVDRVRGQYDALRESPRLGAEDRMRLTAHVELLADLEARINAVAPACNKPVEPEDLASEEVNLPALTTANIDLLVAAIKCDRTRVATLMLCNGTDTRQFSYLPGGPLAEHHSASHQSPYSTEMRDKLRIMNNWYGDQVADLLQKLDVVEDPTTGATYLDNSVVYWGNEDGCNTFDPHYGNAMPVLLAGGCGGALKTGRYLDYRRASGPDGQEQGERILYDYNGSAAEEPTDFKGRPYNSLLISLLQAMGLAPEDYEESGQPGIGSYESNYQNQYSIADGQQPLPFLGV